MIKDVPFNIDLLILSKDRPNGLGEISVLDIYEASTRNFHPQGLFSTEIFGRVGEERRNKLYGYIDLGLEVFHPLIYKKLCDLRQLYGAIIAGSKYAIFDKKLKDFVESNPVDGDTGYEFFIKHFKDIEFEQRPSTQREFAIELVNKYRSNCLMKYLVVLPAGLRDFTVLENGKQEEDEVNSIYRKIMSLSRLLLNANTKTDLTLYNSTRYRLQMALGELYSHFIGLVSGDNGLIQAHWLCRNVMDSTRNVISPNLVAIQDLSKEQSIDMNTTVVGLTQYLACIFPIFINKLRELIVDVFPGSNAPINVIDTKTLKKKQVAPDGKVYDLWMTMDGIQRLVNFFSIDKVKDRVVYIGDSYLGLIYRDGSKVKMFLDIDDLPEGYDKKLVKPITYSELFYLAVAQYAETDLSIITRYPVSNYGNITPGVVYLKTTTVSESLELLDEGWKQTGIMLKSFPILGKAYFNTFSPPLNRLPRMGADFDGDTGNFYTLLTKNSKDEVAAILKEKRHYTNATGDKYFPIGSSYCNMLCGEMSKDPQS